MASKGQIIITFNADASDGEVLSFERTSTLGTITLNSTFVSGSRVSNGQIPLTTPTLNVGEMTAVAYETYFNIDQNQGKLMSISRNINVITIEIAYTWDFQNFSSDVPSIGNVLVPEVPDTFQVDAISIVTNPTDPCDFVNVNVLMTEQATNYSLAVYGGATNAPTVPVSTNPFTVSIPRLSPLKLTVIKGTTSYVVSEYFNEPYFYFRKIGQGNIRIRISQDVFNGATVMFSINYYNQLTQRPSLGTIEYSLDGFNWFENGRFSGQVGGDYTVYVRDGLGCTVQKDFTIPDTLQDRTPFFFVSEANSISFSKNEQWDSLQNGIFKNPNNVLATTDLQQNLYRERLIFREEDEVRIQFKSNYEYHDIFVEDCEGDAVGYTPTIEKMSNNLNLFESLDCKLHTLSNTTAGIYFDSGNYYNEAGVVLGNYELFGNLPDSAIIGNIVHIPTYGVFQVQDIIYKSDINKKLMVFEMNYQSTTDASVVMRCNYNLLDYEIYEFNIDFSYPIIKSGLEKLIRIRIQATDDLFDEINHYSEYSIILDEDRYDQNKYVGINYYGTNNRSVFYAYGITHFIRAEILFINSVIDDDSELVMGDLNTYVSESTVHKGISIKFSEVTYRLMMKLSLALSSEFLFINGLGYAKDKGLKVEPIENTNLYTIECELVSTNTNWNVMAGSEVGQDEGYKTIYIPNIVGTDTGVVKL